MLLILIIILILLWAAVIWSIYSNFLVFYSNFSESENYHKAYYASISALERWELVVKQRQPWYEWSGWVIGWIWTWSFSWSDTSLSWFSYLWDHKDESSVFRSINSLTKRIPATWKWDVERMLSTWDSKNYNIMDYEHTEILLLYRDKLNGNPYTIWDIKYVNVYAIERRFRLPGLLYPKFWQLDTTTTSMGPGGTMPTNDAIVDRQIRWNYQGYPFTIFSTQSINPGPPAQVNMGLDTVIRESDINSMTTATATDHGYIATLSANRSPWYNRGYMGHWNLVADHPTIISENENKFNSPTSVLNGFTYLFMDPTATWIQLRFSLLNLLWTWQNTYPFLEYQFHPRDYIPDKYFTINGQWNYKDYQINTIIQKPTVKESVLWNFTSIF